MRLRANGCVAALAALVLTVGCDTTPRVDSTSADGGPDATSASPQPRESNDTLITTTIQAKYFGTPDVKGRHIDVDTENGVVTLTGRVETDQQKETAEQIARSVTGVGHVVNELTVGAELERPAATTGRADEFRERAERAASRAGDAAERAGTTAGEAVDRAANAVEDGWITTKIQARFFTHDDIKARWIDVDTSNGVVTLSGSVPSAAARSAAEMIARDIEGVAKVVNTLKVDERS